MAMRFFLSVTETRYKQHLPDHLYSYLTELELLSPLTHKLRSCMEHDRKITVIVKLTSDGISIRLIDKFNNEVKFSQEAFFADKKLVWHKVSDDLTLVDIANPTNDTETKRMVSCIEFKLGCYCKEKITDTKIKLR